MEVLQVHRSMCLCVHAATYHNEAHRHHVNFRLFCASAATAVLCGDMGLWWGHTGQMEDAAEVMAPIYEELAIVGAEAGEPDILQHNMGLTVMVGQCTPIYIVTCMVDCSAHQTG